MPRLNISAGAICLGCFWLALDPAGLMLPLLLSAALHELGHLLVLGLSRVPVQALHVTALGCIIQTAPLPYRLEIPCALAGPGVNMLLCALALPRDPSLALVNLCLAGFNLLPLWPLDGGRSLRAMLLLRVEPSCANRVEHVIAGVTLSLLWVFTAYATCVLHMGLAPVLLTSALTIKTGGEKFVAKTRV